MVQCLEEPQKRLSGQLHPGIPDYQSFLGAPFLRTITPNVSGRPRARDQAQRNIVPASLNYNDQVKNPAQR